MVRFESLLCRTEKEPGSDPLMVTCWTLKNIPKLTRNRTYFYRISVAVGYDHSTVRVYIESEHYGNLVIG